MVSTDSGYKEYSKSYRRDGGVNPDDPACQHGGRGRPSLHVLSLYLTVTLQHKRPGGTTRSAMRVYGSSKERTERTSDWTQDYLQ